MKRLSLAAIAAVLGAALLPSLAFAKGPSEASLDGPGLDEPITFTAAGGDGLAPGSPMMELAEATGFFPAVFGGQVPDPMLSKRPKGDLGPRYVISYVVPGPVGEDLILQDVYPYAKPSPVTYMEPGQPVFGTRATHGGWFQAVSPRARPLLVEAGLPKSPPTGGDGSTFPWTVVGTLTALGAVLALGTVAAIRIRRRPEAAATR